MAGLRDHRGLCAEHEILIQNAAVKRASMIINCMNRTQNSKMEPMPIVTNCHYCRNVDTGVIYQNSKLVRAQTRQLKIVSHINLLPVPKRNDAALH